MDKISKNALATLQAAKIGSLSVPQILPDLPAGVRSFAAATVAGSIDVAKQALQETTRIASDHPYIATAIVGGVVLVAAPQLVTVPVLNAAGFTANGVAANSAAAMVQSSIGNVAAGSGFAMLQSAGAGGAGTAVVNAAAQGAGLVTAGVAAGRKWFSKAKL